ncbi:YihD family protein [Endozoicomonadaceae bacterium StTr2]
MSCHRIDELLELMTPEWKKTSKLNLVEIIAQLAEEAGHSGDISTVTDDMLIYHLKMKGMDKTAMIPGLAKDAVSDFKQAMLEARGIKK